MTTKFWHATVYGVTETQPGVVVYADSLQEALTERQAAAWCGLAVSPVVPAGDTDWWARGFAHEGDRLTWSEDPR